MNKPQLQQKPTNSCVAVPKPQQFDVIQRVRDSHISKKKFTTEKEDAISDMAENYFVQNVLDMGLSDEWMKAIDNGRP
jgi:hypothetical protein